MLDNKIKSSPFGSSLPNRSWSDVSRGYRYGFNTQEKDNEIAGEGNIYSAEHWIYDVRIARRWNLDPQYKKYPEESPYVVFHSNPIFISDVNGDEPPKNFKKYSGAGGSIYIPQSSNVVLMKGKMVNARTNQPLNTKDGDVRSFNIGKERFVASYDSKGSFVSYRNFRTGEDYKNPDIYKASGIIDNDVMDLNFKLQNVGKTANAQVIQIAQGSFPGVDVPGNQLSYNSNGRNWVSFVDGGINSPMAQPGQPIAHEANPGTPFYINSNMRNRVGHAIGMTGSISGNNGNLNVNVFDRPTAREYTNSVVKFQTIIVATNFYGSGQTVVMGVYNWGYKNNSGNISSIHQKNQVKFTSISQKSLETLKNDYPAFKLSQ